MWHNQLGIGDILDLGNFGVVHQKYHTGRTGLGAFLDRFSSPRPEMVLYAHSPKRELEPERRGERGEREANDDDRDIERLYAFLLNPPIIC